MWGSTCQVPLYQMRRRGLDILAELRVEEPDRNVGGNDDGSEYDDGDDKDYREEREDINRKKTFSFRHCPNDGGGLPMPEFFGPFQEVHFWSIKRVYFFKYANILNF